MQLTFDIFKALAKFVSYDDRKPYSRIRFAEVVGSNGSQAIATDGAIAAIVAIDDICTKADGIADEDDLICLHSFGSVDPRNVMGEMSISQSSNVEDDFRLTLLEEARHQTIEGFPDMEACLAKVEKDSISLRFDVNKLAAIVELLRSSNSQYIDLVLSAGKPTIFSNEDQSVRGLIMPCHVRSSVNSVEVSDENF